MTTTEGAVGFRLQGWQRAFASDLDKVARKIVPGAGHDAMPLTSLETMVLVLEDRRFFRHHGVDMRSIVRELFKALLLKKHGGASTIDMQFVRTATGYRRRTIRRKLYEACLALAIQSRYEKRVILRSYIACAYYGTGLTGAESAAVKLFGKPANHLDLEEGALVAAMLACPRPSRGPASWEARAKRRAKYGIAVHARRQLRGHPQKQQAGRDVAGNVTSRPPMGSSDLSAAEHQRT